MIGGLAMTKLGLGVEDFQDSGYRVRGTVYAAA
jgi:hypothetical protein